MPWSIVTRQRQ